MKLILFTPTVATSAIGRMANLVSRALISHGHQVTIVRTERAGLFESTTHDFGVGLVRWNDFTQMEHLAAGADALIYQIGNNYEFHQGCLEWLPKLRGLVCLHDFFLGHLFYGWAQGRQEQADAVLHAWYGKKIADRFFSYQDSEAFIEGTRNTSPMTEWVCSMADGVISHSSWGIDRVVNSCPGPVHVTPLAYNVSKEISNTTSPHYSGHDRFNILTVGHINQNKRIARVIQAIGNSSILRRHSTTYRLVGKIQPEIKFELSTLAKKCQVNLVISGEVNDDTLVQAIEQADVISCLRWPSLEAASASAIEAMLYGKPAIVTNTGFYCDIPDNCVIKIDQDQEVHNIQLALEQLCEDADRRCALGLQGQRWAKDTFSAENYAQKLIDVASSIAKTKPTINAINHFIKLIRGWGSEGNLACNSHITEPLHLFQERARVEFISRHKYKQLL